jgi:hypothetical protein
LPDYPGMLHLAAAVRSRCEWTDAFIRSRIGQRWGFLPSQLGLHPMSYSAFARRRCMGRSHTDLPSMAPELPSSGLERRVGVPTADERDALVALLWEKGRPVGGKRPEPPSQGKLRSTFSYSRRPAWSKLTYLCHLAFTRGAKREKRESYSVPAEYDAMKGEWDPEGVHVCAPVCTRSVSTGLVANSGVCRCGDLLV